jgi:hypothetical protein
MPSNVPTARQLDAVPAARELRALHHLIKGTVAAPGEAGFDEARRP